MGHRLAKNDIILSHFLSLSIFLFSSLILCHISSLYINTIYVYVFVCIYIYTILCVNEFAQESLDQDVQLMLKDVMDRQVLNETLLMFFWLFGNFLFFISFGLALFIRIAFHSFFSSIFSLSLRPLLFHMPIQSILFSEKKFNSLFSFFLLKT